MLQTFKTVYVFTVYDISMLATKLKVNKMYTAVLRLTSLCVNAK
jgi:hypothetical protein